ncbi:MAG TPA: VWA domain-containing protein [Candidatus Eremiobacteraceae bacterium]|nr:VWA domain-containing protein [Candidatus Eremiobacteraceae bacterium]
MTAEKTSREKKRWSRLNRLALALVFVLALLGGCLGVLETGAQTAGIQTQSSSTQSPQTQSAQTQSAPDVPDAPSAVQPPSEAPAPPPPARPPEEKKPAPVERNPWTNQPVNKTETEPGSEPAEETSAPPPMPPVKTVTPGTSNKPGSNPQDQLYTLVVHSNFVQVPVTVKFKDGRPVDGLLSTDFAVYENGVKQKLTFFSADPFALSVAIVLDLGMPDAAVQEVNQTFSALVGAFAPYDDVALYTYSSTVSQVSDFTGAKQKLVALLNQMKSVRGSNNGVPVTSGPMQSGPIINGIPVGQPTQPVNTPPKEAHVLNDAILQAALDLRKRDRTRRKIIFVISDGREYGSKASYSDVLRVLLSNEIQVRAVAVSSAALPLYDRLERLRLPKQGYDNILPKYTYATGAGQPYAKLTRNTIEDAYADAMSEARNQYTLGYTPAPPKTLTRSAKREIEVRVDHPGLTIEAKDGYYPAPAAR